MRGAIRRAQNMVLQDLLHAFHSLTYLRGYQYFQYVSHRNFRFWMMMLCAVTSRVLLRWWRATVRWKVETVGFLTRRWMPFSALCSQSYDQYRPEKKVIFFTTRTENCTQFYEISHQYSYFPRSTTLSPHGQTHQTQKPSLPRRLENIELCQLPSRPKLGSCANYFLTK